MKYYAVKVGREPGIYTSWPECQKQITSYPDAEYKSFTTLESASLYLNNVSPDKIKDNALKKWNSEGHLYIFCDGSYMASTNIYAYAYIIPQFKYQHFKRNIEFAPTNNRNELLAIRDGLEYIYSIRETDSINKLRKIVIISDSEYSVKSITVYSKKWFDKNLNIIDDTKKNLDIIKNILEMIGNMDIKIEFIHTKAHTGNMDAISLFNADVDKLAAQK